MDLNEMFGDLRRAVTARRNRKKVIVAGVILLFLLVAAFAPSSAEAKPVMSVSTDSGNETIVLHDDKGECPSGTTSAGVKWDARVATYTDNRDGEKQTGCYVIDVQSEPKVVIVIFKKGSYAGAPLYIPAQKFKPAI